VLPPLPVNRRRLVEAVVFLEPLQDRPLERAETGLGDDVDPRVVDRLVEDRSDLPDLRQQLVGGGASAELISST